ncbi:MAG: hypothetical protein ABR616_09965 [Dermatophilaceae bacterium]
MPDEPRARIEITVTGSNYDAIVADARARAFEFLGPERTYWMELAAHPIVDLTEDGDTVTAWRADVAIAYPADPAF